jgi:hypothetical protein
VADQIELARSAEAAGWDGVFTWDGIHVGDDAEVHDPWVLMSAFAMATERVRIGAIIQPLSRRRSLDGFDVVEGTTTPAVVAEEHIGPWRDAGATWWIESDWSTWGVAPARRRIEAGPPR